MRSTVPVGGGRSPLALRHFIRMKTDACPKCGSVKRERGEILPVGSNWDVRFKSETSSAFSFKKKVAALEVAEVVKVPELAQQVSAVQTGKIFDSDEEVLVWDSD